MDAAAAFDWAEYAYPGLFPKVPAPQNFSLPYLGVLYTVRGYANGNYLGVTPGNDIYGLGPFTKHELTRLGNLSEFAAQIRADACSVQPGSCDADRAGKLFDWAEQTYPALFPKGPQNANVVRDGVDYVERAYANGNALRMTRGSADPMVHGFGPFTGNVLLLIGKWSDFAAVVSPGNAPPVANGDSYATPQGTQLVVPAPGVLGNDTDADGDALSAVLLGQPANGSVRMQLDGGFTYTPPAGYVGTVTFQYVADDGEAASTAATVTINVTAPPPQACQGNPSDPSLSSALIGSEGGSVRSPDGQAELRFPSDPAYAGGVRVCIESVPAPEDLKPVIAGYRISAHPAGVVRSTPFTFGFSPLDASGLGLPVVQPDGSLQADVQIPVIGKADGRFAAASGAQTTGDAGSAAPVATEVSLTELPASVFLPGQPSPPSDGVSLFRTTVLGERSALVGNTETLTVQASANTIFSADVRDIAVRLRRVGGHGPAQIDFGALGDGTFHELGAIGDGDYVSGFGYTCNQAGVYPIVLDITFSGNAAFFADGAPLSPGGVLNQTSISLSLTCTAPVAQATYTRFDPAEALYVEAISLIRYFVGLVGGSSMHATANSSPASTSQGQFPVPNATPDSLPMIVATTGVGPFTSARGPVGAIAVDAATGGILFRYTGNSVPFFDALPLEPPADDPSLQPGSTLSPTRRLDLLGQFACGLQINNDGTGEGGCAAGVNSRDAAYLLGSRLGYTSVQGSPGRVQVTRYKRFSESDPPSFQLDGGLLVPSGTLPDIQATAIGNADASRFLVAGSNTSGPGELWFVDRSRQDPLTGTRAQATLVGTLGRDPRRLRCGTEPLNGSLHLCAISDFRDSTVTLLSWDGMNAPTLGPAIAVGDGPVGIDVFGHRIVVAGFNDDSYTLLTVNPADPLNAGGVTTLRRALANTPAVAACTRPGHAVFVGDAERRIAISCNGSNGVAVIPQAHD
ncbi:MAG: cadherin-like domain-containing protein [Rubrivivax sp.]|nr:cadherin-like domain-containing protein [Rubrivivax sp.]